MYHNIPNIDSIEAKIQCVQLTKATGNMEWELVDCNSFKLALCKINAIDNTTNITQPLSNNQGFIKEFVDCYGDSDADPLLNAFTLVLMSKDPDNCIFFCFGKGTNYAGIRNGVSCYCGNNVDKVTSLL